MPIRKNESSQDKDTAVGKTFVASSSLGPKIISSNSLEPNLVAIKSVYPWKAGSPFEGMQELSDQRSKVLTEYELRFRCIIESKDLKDIMLFNKNTAGSDTAKKFY